MEHESYVQLHMNKLLRGQWLNVANVVIYVRNNEMRQTGKLCKISDRAM